VAVHGVMSMILACPRATPTRYAVLGWLLIRLPIFPPQRSFLLQQPLLLQLNSQERFLSGCASCKHFQGLSSMCDKYQAKVDGNFVCDTWEGKQQEMSFKAPPLPAAPALPSMPALSAVKMSASTTQRLIKAARDRLHQPLAEQPPALLPVELLAPQEKKAAVLLAYLEALLKAELSSLCDALYKTASRPMRWVAKLATSSLPKKDLSVLVGGIAKIGGVAAGETGASGSRPGSSGPMTMAGGSVRKARPTSAGSFSFRNRLSISCSAWGLRASACCRHWTRSARGFVSHNLTVLSPEPDARVAPSGLKASEKT
jgi:hypothetical protein